MFNKLLVTGGRDFTDETYIHTVLNRVYTIVCFDVLINGWARGVDKTCHKWGLKNGIQPVAVEAMWDAQGPKAGPLRNRLMYDLFQPQTLLAFPGGTGTNDMVSYVAGKKRQGHEVTLLFSEDFI